MNIEILLAALIFSSVAMTLYLITGGGGTDASRALSRLRAIGGAEAPASAEEKELARPFRERVVLPMFSWVGGFFSRFTPKALSGRTSSLLIQAGMPRVDPSTILGIKAALAFSLAFTSIAAGFFFQLQGKTLFLLVLAAGVAGVMLPGLWLQMVTAGRKSAINSALPDLLDLLSVSMEAGLGFDKALDKATEKLKGPLRDEIKRTVNEMRIGRARSESFRSMSERVSLPDLTSFIAALIQSDQLGVSISSTLRVQSDSIRMKRRQVAEEAALKAPVKMLFPLILFIFPTIFIILLAPAFMSIVENFK